MQKDEAARSESAPAGPAPVAAPPGFTYVVDEARKDWKRAAEYYRRAADFAEQNAGFDQEGIDDFRDAASRLEEKSASEK